MQHYTYLIGVLEEIQGFAASVFYSIQRIKALYEAPQLDAEKLEQEYKFYENNLDNMKLYLLELKNVQRMEEEDK